MSDPPFGFSSGDDPDREKREKKEHDSGSGASDPLGAFGISGDFGMGDLGQIFTQLGQMFSSAGTMTAGGQSSGPVNYELARQVASSSIGVVAPLAPPPPAEEHGGGGGAPPRGVVVGGGPRAPRRHLQGGGLEPR